MMEKKILKGPEITFPFIEKSFGELFFDQADKFHDRVFQIDADSGKQQTYGEVKTKCVQAALHLQNLGCQPNDVVMICSENNLNNIVPVMATLFVGGYVSSVDPKQTVDEVKYLINLVKPKFVFIQEDFTDFIEASLRDTGNKPKIITINSALKTDREENTFTPIKRDIHDTAFIFFSSGSTSLPKGICWSHFGVLHGSSILAHELDIVKAERLTHFSSLYWISGALLTGTIVANGWCKVIAPNISGLQFLECVEKHKINYMFTSNTFTYEITNLDKKVIEKYDLSSLHSIRIGGSVLSTKQLLKLREVLPETKITVCYGSTEGGFVTSFDLRDETTYHNKLLSSGKLINGVEMKIVDIESGKLLGANEPGELVIKTPYQMTGYYNFSKPDTFDDDGFLRTGDIGYYDEDEYVYITDRINETFKYKTRQVSPVTIEQVLLEHPAIEQAVVFGVPHEVDKFHPAACVVLKNDIQSKINISGKDLLKFVSEKVSDKNQLRGGLKILESLPKTTTGKVLRRAARDDFIKSLNNNNENSVCIL